MEELFMLVNLQRKMLEFTIANSTYTDALFRATMEDEFVDWLINLRAGTGKSPKIANRFQQELTDYVHFSRSDKELVLQDFEIDQNFYERINDSSFSFSMLPSKSKFHEKAKKCLCEFYELLGLGYPPGLVGKPHGSSVFNKESVVNAYKTSNPNIEFVCPCCDNAFSDSAAANEQGYTLEHFFPKSLYPSICMHPLNLIPMCSGCNSRKGDLDPLNPSPLIVIPYDEAFHPLARPVRKYADLNFKSERNYPTQMVFVSINPPPTFSNSIGSYSTLYQIPDRWVKNWRRIDNRIAISMNRTIKNLQRAQIHDHLFDQALGEVIEEFEENYGIDQFSYPAAKWLIWAKQNIFNELEQTFLED